MSYNYSSSRNNALFEDSDESVYKDGADFFADERERKRYQNQRYYADCCCRCEKCEEERNLLRLRRERLRILYGYDC